MITYRTAPGTLCEVLDGKAAIVNPEGTELLTLNPVGSLIWTALSEHPDSGLHQLTAAVMALDGAPDKEEAEADVRAFLDELVARGLVIAQSDGTSS